MSPQLPLVGVSGQEAEEHPAGVCQVADVPIFIQCPLPQRGKKGSSGPEGAVCGSRRAEPAAAVGSTCGQWPEGALGLGECILHTMGRSTNHISLQEDESLIWGAELRVARWG